MKYHLNYYNDELRTAAKTNLPAAKRIVYVHSGAATVNGKFVAADNAVYTDGKTVIVAGAKGARIFRWDLTTSKNAVLAKGKGAKTKPRMLREIWSIDYPRGSPWLFRLDSIDNPPGVVADVHTHPGPGIRALLRGTFHVNQPSEEGSASKAGDPWWETGVEAVISTPSTRTGSAFLRCMVLPTEFQGRPDTAKWLRKTPRVRSGWHLFVDEIVTL